MSKKAYFIGIGCFIAGLGFGIVGSMAYFGKVTADGLFLVKEMEVADSGTRAFAAYQRESNPVAVYALSQHLVTLQKAQEIGSESPVFMTRLQIIRELAFTHARLAKLQGASGQAELGAKHMAEALKHIAQTEKYTAVTNEAALMELVAKFDERGLP